MKKAYSYIRFSSQKQELGDSLRRQLAMSEAYAQKHGLDLDTATYRDLGVSAFDRTNLERGALAAFLLAVESGLVAKGSYLLVENLDRLSRAYVHTALKLLTDLVDAGITVVTLVDGKVWDSESIKDVTSLLMSVLIFHRAHEESQLKSHRISAAWEKKREEAYQGVFPTSEVPRWLKIMPDRKGVEPIPDLVVSIKKVFELLSSGLGNSAIITKANKERWPAPSTSGVWHLSLISRLFHNRSLLGEYQPHARIDGVRVPKGDPVKLYPAVISQELWDAAHLSRRIKLEMPRRRDNGYRNIFQGILLCGCCGASFVRKQKAPSDRASGYNKAGYTRYYCSDRTRGITKCQSAPSIMIEGSLLFQILKLAAGYVSQTDKRAKELLSEHDKFVARISAINTKIERLVDTIEITGPVPAVIERLTEARDEQKKLAIIIDDLKNKIDTLPLKSSVNSDMKVIEEILRSGDSQGRAELRERLIRLVSRIWVWPEKELAVIEWRSTGITAGAVLGENGRYEDFENLERPLHKSGHYKIRTSE